MTKAFKAFAVSLIVIVALIVAACRPNPKVDPTKTSTSATTDTRVPDISATAATTQTTDTVTRVVQPTDFVQTDTKVQTEDLPSNLEDLNRMAQEKGYIGDAFFIYNESTLSEEAQATLTTAAGWLNNHRQYSLLIEGHCDERGTEQYNLALGDRRANTVKDFLTSLGVDASRIRTVSYGEERPFDEGHNESAWAKNRRGHLVLVR
jgi:peptidoglycan-associated lipoprotein